MIVRYYSRITVLRDTFTPASSYQHLHFANDAKEKKWMMIFYWKKKGKKRGYGRGIQNNRFACILHVAVASRYSANRHRNKSTFQRSATLDARESRAMPSNERRKLSHISVYLSEVEKIGYFNENPPVTKGCRERKKFAKKTIAEMGAAAT